jgi:hypothetical protein
MHMHMLIERKCNITSKIGEIPATVSFAVSTSRFEEMQQNGHFVARDPDLAEAHQRSRAQGEIIPTGTGAKGASSDVE